MNDPEKNPGRLGTLIVSQGPWTDMGTFELSERKLDESIVAEIQGASGNAFIRVSNKLSRSTAREPQDVGDFARSTAELHEVLNENRRASTTGHEERDPRHVREIPGIPQGGEQGINRVLPAARGDGDHVARPAQQPFEFSERVLPNEEQRTGGRDAEARDERIVGSDGLAHGPLVKKAGFSAHAHQTSQDGEPDASSSSCRTQDGEARRGPTEEA